MNDPQNSPPPGWKPPTRQQEFWASLGKLLLTVCRIAIKVVVIVVLFFVALIGAIAW